MKRLKAILKNQNGASQIAVFGGLLLFSMVILAAALGTIDGSIDSAISTVTSALESNISTIGGL